MASLQNICSVKYWSDC